MLNLILETTTGRLVPAGVVPALPRGPVDATLQLVTESVAALLPEGQPVSLKLYAPGDTDTPLATFAAWTRNPAFALYTATLNPLTTDLAWTQLPVLLGRISYSTPNVDSPLFHVSFAGAGQVVGAAMPPIVIPHGPVFAPMQFTGKLVVGQVFGYFRASVATRIYGAQLSAQTAPTGEAAQLGLVDSGGEALDKVATLAAGQKDQETLYDAPLDLEAGDVVRCKILQVGSSTPGGYLTCNLICEAL